MTDTFPKTIHWAFRGYDKLWKPALPVLHRHVKLREGFDQRLLKAPFKHPADIWIQAASAGESYLAGMLLERLTAETDLRILTTTNTRQGMDILADAASRLPTRSPGGRLQTHYFPFDRPAVMHHAVSRLQPRLMVLLETELWPGHLYTLRRTGIPVVMVNARLQARSLRAYRLWPTLWRQLAPNRILAVSAADAERLGRLFGPECVERMPNMKFDRIPISSVGRSSATPRFWTRHLPARTPFVVLGSIHRAEEKLIARMIDRLREKRPDVVVGVFPRHMHRIDALCRRLRTAGFKTHRRSLIDGPIARGSVVVGDVFGELVRTYPSAAAAFVGGSLKPLGGHNFLEPLMAGAATMIGPHWRAFEWVGTDLVRQRLVHEAADWRKAVHLLMQAIETPTPRHVLQRRAAEFLRQRRGGTKQACRAIREFLDDRPRRSEDQATRQGPV